MLPTAATPLGSLVAANPASARILEEFHLDYCCRGQRTLEEACRNAGVDLARVLERLETLSRNQATGEQPDWAHESLAKLVRHIVDTHHVYLREELPSLAASVEKLRAVHGANHPELVSIAEVYGALHYELESHMLKEERILFPYCETLEAATSLPNFHCGTLANPIRVMEHEHDVAGDALRELRRLSGDYRPPADGCATYRNTFARLEALELDLHQHIHLENNILFPRVLELEASLTQQA